MNIPTLHGNWIDLVIILVLALYVIGRWHHGFIEGTVDLIGFFVSLALGLKFYTFAANTYVSNFSLPIGIANALGFLSISFIVGFVYYLIAGYILGYFDRLVFETRANKVLGSIPSLISGLILISFILTLFLVFPVRPDIKNAIIQSKIGGFLTGQTQVISQKMNDIFGSAAQETLTFMTIEPEAKSSVNLHFTTTDFQIDPTSEQEMLTLVNGTRLKQGLHALSENDALREVGRAHCADMFRRGYFSHYTPDGLSPFDRMQKAGIVYTTAGENIAYAPTVDIAESGFMNSPGHRANILSAGFGQVGIGVVDASVYGKMFCQEFTN